MIDLVTVTGADDSTDPRDLLEIAENWPFVEFGILLSKNSANSNRFPSREWIIEFSKLCNNSDLDLNISGHVCGSWVKDIYMGNWPTGIPPEFERLAKRWQLNTHGAPHEFSLDNFMILIASKNDLGQQIIFQYDKANDKVMNEAIRLKLDVSALYDLSHGAGVLPEKWEVPSNDIYCGFAGGLSPQNVKEEIEKIMAVTDKSFWIDAETKLRSNDDKLFDLELITNFLEASERYVAE